MSSIFDKINELKDLPPGKLNLSAEQEQQLSKLQSRLERITYSRSIRDKYVHLPISSDAFTARKAVEVELEDHRR